MSVAVERWLARVYTDEALRQRFLVAPDEALADSDLTPAEIERLRELDRMGLRLHARASSKHAAHAAKARPLWRDHLRALWERRRHRPP